MQLRDVLVWNSAQNSRGQSPGVSQGAFFAGGQMEGNTDLTGPTGHGVPFRRIFLQWEVKAQSCVSVFPSPLTSRQLDSNWQNL